MKVKGFSKPLNKIKLTSDFEKKAEKVLNRAKMLKMILIDRCTYGFRNQA